MVEVGAEVVEAGEGLEVMVLRPLSMRMEAGTAIVDMEGVEVVGEDVVFVAAGEVVTMGLNMIDSRMWEVTIRKHLAVEGVGTMGLSIIDNRM